jgi:hypothetical protein
LIWQRLDTGQASRIKHTVEGGYDSPESEWPAIHDQMVNAMIRLENAFRPYLEQLD